MGEKLITEAFTFRRAADEPGNIDEGKPRRNDLGGVRDIRERL